MNRSTAPFLLAVITLALMITSNLWAQCDACGGGCTGGQCRGAVCVGEAEWVDVEKHCWDVECKEICVPAVRFPWERGGKKFGLRSLFSSKCDQDCSNPNCSKSYCDGGCVSTMSCGCAGVGCATCCPAKCGFVVAVRGLKKNKYTEKTCAYSMSLQGPAAPTGCEDGSHFSCASCRSAPPSDVVSAQDAHLTSAPEPAVRLVAPRSVGESSQPQAGQPSRLRISLVSLKSKLFGPEK